MTDNDRDVVPDDEDGRNTMLQLMKLNLPGHAAALGVTNAELTQTIADANAFVYGRTLRNGGEAFKEETSAFLRLITDGADGSPTPDMPIFEQPPVGDVVFKVGIIKRLRKLIKKIKLSENFTESIGRDLYIIRDKQRVPSEEKQPTLEVKAIADDKVELKFNKQGMKAVRIKRILADGTTQTVADPTDSPYIDETPSPNGKPEKRQYQAIYLENNKPVGQYSDIKTVVTTP